MKKKGIVWAAAAGLALAVGLIIVQVIGTNQGGDDGGQGKTITPYWEGLPVAGMAIGPQDAPVLVEEYFDFQCPQCQIASDEIVKPFVEQVVSKGQARFAYRLYPILGPESVTAARGAYCAAVQGKFWPFQAILFAERGTGNRGTYTESSLRSYAEQAGLDVSAFQTCLASGEAAIFVGGAYERAVQLGIPGTPVYFVNGRAVAVRSLDDLVRAVEEASP